MLSPCPQKGTNIIPFADKDLSIFSICCLVTYIIEISHNNNPKVHSNMKRFRLPCPHIYHKSF